MATTEVFVPTTMRACCESCGRKITLDTIDYDGVLIGAECPCGYYVTRYLPGQSPR